MLSNKAQWQWGKSMVENCFKYLGRQSRNRSNQKKIDEEQNHRNKK